MNMRPINEVLKQEPTFSLDQEQVETICDSILRKLIDNLIPELKKEVIEDVKDYLTKNNFADCVQKWVIEEFAPEVQNWVVNEFSPEIESWVKEYMNDKRTQLHIKDFCANDDDRCGQCAMTEEIDEPVRKMGTIEPRYNDEKVSIAEDKCLCDDALAFIYGAIKKYGTSEACLGELKEYILKEASYIGYIGKQKR